MTVSINNEVANQTIVHIGDLSLFFSYYTIVAFRKGDKEVCCENVWTSTTGKFLNVIEPDKKKRVNQVAFGKLLDEVLTTIKVV
jgi:hypothetical protein